MQSSCLHLHNLHTSHIHLYLGTGNSSIWGSGVVWRVFIGLDFWCREGVCNWILVAWSLVLAVWVCFWVPLPLTSSVFCGEGMSLECVSELPRQQLVWSLGGLQQSTAGNKPNLSVQVKREGAERAFDSCLCRSLLYVWFAFLSACSGRQDLGASPATPAELCHKSVLGRFGLKLGVFTLRFFLSIL